MEKGKFNAMRYSSVLLLTVFINSCGMMSNISVRLVERGLRVIVP